MLLFLKARVYNIIPCTSWKITPYELLVREVNKIQALAIFLSCQLKLLDKTVLLKTPHN